MLCIFVTVCEFTATLVRCANREDRRGAERPVLSRCDSITRRTASCQRCLILVECSNASLSIVSQKETLESCRWGVRR